MYPVIGDYAGKRPSQTGFVSLIDFETLIAAVHPIRAIMRMCDEVLVAKDIIVALNDVGYGGPLSVEWEEIRMDRVHGATEAAAFVRKFDFPASVIAFDR